MTAMTNAKFEELASIYGSKIAWWPEEDQAAATALLAESTAAQDVLKAEQALDAAMDDWKAPAPSEALMAKILGDAAEVSAAQITQAAPTREAPAKPGFFSRFFGEMGWRPVGAMTACLAVGFVAGLSGAPAPIDGTSQDMASVEADNAVITAFFDDDLDSDPFDLEIL